MMNMRGPRPMHRPQGPHGHPGPARLPGHGGPGHGGPGHGGPGIGGPGIGVQGHGGPVHGGPVHGGPVHGGPGGPPGGPPGMRPQGPGPLRPPVPVGMRPMAPGSGPGPGLTQRPPRPQVPIGPPASNITNDPKSAHCRIFVGNLNTILMKKEDVEQIFRRYGMVSGISMHKGYAFVQYSHPDEARRAAVSEDGKMYASQVLDINIASEPKKSGGKRPAVGLKGDAPDEKKKKMDGPVSGQNAGGRTLVSVSGGMGGTKLDASATSITLARPTGKALKKTTISTGNDILVCGNCKSLYHSLANFVQHKKQKCELKTLCKCQQLTDNSHGKEPLHHLLCAVCDAQFLTAWDLCQHCQQEHSIAIFKEHQIGADTLNGDKN